MPKEFYITCNIWDKEKSMYAQKKLDRGVFAKKSACTENRSKKTKQYTSAHQQDRLFGGTVKSVAAQKKSIRWQKEPSRGREEDGVKLGTSNDILNGSDTGFTGGASVCVRSGGIGGSLNYNMYVDGVNSEDELKADESDKRSLKEKLGTRVDLLEILLTSLNVNEITLFDSPVYGKITANYAVSLGGAFIGNMNGKELHKWVHLITKSAINETSYTKDNISFSPLLNIKTSVVYQVPSHILSFKLAGEFQKMLTPKDGRDFSTVELSADYGFYGGVFRGIVGRVNYFHSGNEIMRKSHSDKQIYYGVELEYDSEWGRLSFKALEGQHNEAVMAATLSLTIPLD